MKKPLAPPNLLVAVEICAEPTVEIEVCELVAQGMTNDQIATRLRLSKRTIDAHLEHIRGKLDVRSRVEIAAWLRARPESSLS